MLLAQAEDVQARPVHQINARCDGFFRADVEEDAPLLSVGA
jgi:hypothetical protein